jgi:hypothetical protein
MYEGIVTRRALLGGLGAGGAAVVTSTGVLGATASAAGAEGTRPFSAAGGDVGAAAVESIESTRTDGVTYLYRSADAFSALLAPVVAPADAGYYTSAVPGDPDPGGVLTCELDVPVGAELVDVEWYVANTSSSNVYAGMYQWLPGGLSGYGDTEILLSEITPSLELQAVSTSFGAIDPWPANARLVAGITAPGSGEVQLNGIRVGYRGGARRTVLLSEPVRAYDSRQSGGPIASNVTRQVSLASALPWWASGVLFELSITGTNGSGTLRVGRGGATPAATAVQWARSNDKVTTMVVSDLSASRSIAVLSAFSTGSTNFIVDVVGYLV